MTKVIRGRTMMRVAMMRAIRNRTIRMMRVTKGQN
jgi:hypothetical protein